MLADTHIHIWDFDQAEYAWLKGNTGVLGRTYSIGELEAERQAVGVTKGVLVQAANNFEDTDWMLKVAAETDWIAAVVGWLPLTDSAATEHALTTTYKHNPYFKGVRHLIHDEADPKWLLQPSVIDSLIILAEHNISFDIVGVLPAHIETALKVAAQVPGLRMVFDHLNQPPIATAEKYGVWGSLMQEAASHSGFYAKISGLGLTSQKGMNWTAVDIQPYIEKVLEWFGTDRCFCGGDWPVALLAGSYTYTWTQFKQVLHHVLDDSARQKVFYANAAAFYSF